MTDLNKRVDRLTEVLESGDNFRIKMSTVKPVENTKAPIGFEEEYEFTLNEFIAMIRAALWMIDGQEIHGQEKDKQEG